MTVASIDWDVAGITRDLIDNQWGQLPASAGPTKPAHIELFSEDSSGNARTGVDYTEEYILVSETGDRTREYSDGPRDVVDLGASAHLEASTPQGRTRREAIWAELLVIAEYARKRSQGTPGDWDTVDVTAAPVDDQVFNWWSLEMTWNYSATGRVL